MGSEEGWTNEFTQWWFEFLSEKGGKGVSKDTWMMVSRNRPRERSSNAVILLQERASSALRIMFLMQNLLVPRIRPGNRLEVRELR